MGSPYAYEPLCAVPPVVDQQLRFALLLELKHALNAARDAVASVTGRAAGVLRRLATRLHLPVPVAWLRGAASQLRSSVPAVSRVLGRSGRVAVAVAVLSSPAARRTLQPVLITVGAAARRAANAFGRLPDRTLRLFGQPGQQAAEQLSGRARALRSRLADFATPTRVQLARLLDPDAPHLQLAAGLARSYLLHLALRSAFRSAVVRLLVESIVIPLLLDTGLGRRLHTVLVQLQVPSAAAAQGSAQPDLPTAGENSAPAGMRPSASAAKNDRAHVEPAGAEEAASSTSQPLNRAQRRAQQRQQAPQRRTPRTG